MTGPFRGYIVHNAKIVAVRGVCVDEETRADITAPTPAAIRVLRSLRGTIDLKELSVWWKESLAHPCLTIVLILEDGRMFRVDITDFLYNGSGVVFASNGAPIELGLFKVPEED